jgi:hypothetical protein
VRFTQDEILLAELREESEEHADRLEREHLHDDPSVDAELVSPAVRRRYKESGAF